MFLKLCNANFYAIDVTAIFVIYHRWLTKFRWLPLNKESYIQSKESSPVERLELLNSAEFIPLDSDSTVEKERSQHSGKGTGMRITPSTDRVANCQGAGCASQSSAVGSESTREGCDCVSTHSGVTGTCTYTLAHLCDLSSYTVTDARVETPSGIVVSSDEIDNEKSDTFSPFVSEQSQQDTPPIRPEDFCRVWPLQARKAR